MRAALLLVAAFACGCPNGTSPAKDAPIVLGPAPTPQPAAPPPKSPLETPSGPPIRRDGTMFGTSELMGTTVSLNVYVGTNADPSKAAKAMEDALGEMARIETLMSEWRPASELSLLNDAAGGEAMQVSADLFKVLTRAKAIHAESDGAFDVTFHGVGHLWSFKPGATPPTKQAIAKALPRVDGSKVELDADAKTVRLPIEGMKIGLGAIAKGYAVDRASALLRERGFNDHVVEAGGDTYAAGTKGGTTWRVGVKNPEGGGSLGVLSVQERAIVTSGDYMRFFEHAGQRYAHILDPKTGWPIPASKSPKSVTLLAANAMDADAYCTAVAVMGAQAGLAFVEKHEALEAVIIARDGEVLVSSGLEGVYAPLPPLTPER